MKKPIEVPSATVKSKKYVIVYDTETGIGISCNCPAFLFHNPFRKNCKHLDAFKMKPEKKEEEIIPDDF